MKKLAKTKNIKNKQTCYLKLKKNINWNKRQVSVFDVVSRIVKFKQKFWYCKNVETTIETNRTNRYSYCDIIFWSIPATPTKEEKRTVL